MVAGVKIRIRIRVNVFIKQTTLYSGEGIIFERGGEVQGGVGLSSLVEVFALGFVSSDWGVERVTSVLSRGGGQY